MRWFILVFILSCLKGGYMAEDGVNDLTPPSSVKIDNFSIVHLPTDRSVSHQISFKNMLIVGTDEAIWTKVDAYSNWQKTLPYMVWNSGFFIEGDYVYVTINTFNRKAKRVLPQLYRSDDGMVWELVLEQAPELITVAPKTNDIFLGSKFSYYSAAISSGKLFGKMSGLPDNRILYDLHDIQAHKQSLFVSGVQGVGRSTDGGKTFKHINHLFGGAIGKVPIIRFLSNDDRIVVEINSNRLFVSDNAGESWIELTRAIPELRSKRGYSLNRMYALDGLSRMIVSHNSTYYLLDLKNHSIRELGLPTFYEYTSFSILEDGIYVSALHPKSKQVTTPGSEERDYSKEASLSPLLKLSLTPASMCDAIYGTHTPKLASDLVREFVVSGDTIYINTGKAIRNSDTDSILMDSLDHAMSFTKGHKGYWYMQNSVKEYEKGQRVLLRTKDSGKKWNTILTDFTIPKTSVYDDSLNYAYHTFKHSVIRRDLRDGSMDQQSLGGLDNEILKLQIDASSRLWALSKKGLFISTIQGFWESPLPSFQHQIPLSGFALHRGKMIIGNDQELFISRTDTLSWKPLIFDTKCKNAKSMRLLASSKELLVLQDIHSGHIWLWNIVTDFKQRLIYSIAKYGIIEHVGMTPTRILVRSSGIPFKTIKKIYKEKPARGLIYHIKI